MTFNDLGNLIVGLIVVAAWVAIFFAVESHAREKERLARERNGSAQISALRAAAVKGDSVDLVV